ncbi:MAG: Cys-tRNA(Pro) deacylase [Acidimicrobiales bacterium]
MTPAITLLEQAKVTHRVLTYEHDPASEAYGLEAADALGLDPELVFKTLVVSLQADGAERHAVAVVPVSANLDLKAFAAAAGVKRAAMADRGDAERITGYVRGGISPLGQKKRLLTFVDGSAETTDVLYVSGGRRGVDIELAPTDLVSLTGGRFASIAT